jgi:hypothetical protein
MNYTQARMKTTPYIKFSKSVFGTVQMENIKGQIHWQARSNKQANYMHQPPSTDIIIIFYDNLILNFLHFTKFYSNTRCVDYEFDGSFKLYNDLINWKSDSLTWLRWIRQNLNNTNLVQEDAKIKLYSDLEILIEEHILKSL